MITAAETKRRFDEDQRWWKIPLMDFIDDFRHYKDEKAFAQPFELGDEEKDAVFAGVIETLCDELGLRVPPWLAEVPPCSRPSFYRESPVRLRLAGSS